MTYKHEKKMKINKLVVLKKHNRDNTGLAGHVPCCHLHVTATCGTNTKLYF